MKKLVLACLPAVVLAVPSQALAWGQGNCGFSFGFQWACPLPQAGPWYSYWPYEAHFINPAPTGYPYWPSPQTLPGAAMGGAPAPTQVPPGGAPAAPFSPSGPAPAPTPVPQPAPVRPLNFQPVGYTTQAPSYWYSR
jgi:hypothetical protein